MKYKYTEKDIEIIKKARVENHDKRVDRRLRALELKFQGKHTDKEIAKITEYNPWYISKLAAKYRKGGIESITENHYGGNHRNMTFEEEEKILSNFIDESDGGHLTDVSEIKSAYDKAVGHETGRGQIYYVLNRHGWTKKMPRSKHPKSATSEAVEASKKLTPESKN